MTIIGEERKGGYFDARPTIANSASINHWLGGCLSNHRYQPPKTPINHQSSSIKIQASANIEISGNPSLSKYMRMT